jgi:hypothetical protein
MAELILTDEEKAAVSWLEWDDASLGKLIKYLSVHMGSDEQRKQLLYSQSAALHLIADAVKFGAETMRVEQKGVTKRGEPLGDWEVIVRRIDPDRLEAPWTEAQVQQLTRYQREGKFHPYTCGQDGCRGVLVASQTGWKCPVCDHWTQTWCHLIHTIPFEK